MAVDETASNPWGFGAPSSARIYDYLLGGRDNFPRDRAAAERVLVVAPEARTMARQNRRFLVRAVRYLAAECGIEQFIDNGPGIPTAPSVHEVARTARRGARVAYVDNDPMVLSHSRAVIDPPDQVICVDGDFRRPDAVLGDPDLRATIALDRPVAVLFSAVLHFVTDDVELSRMLAAYRDAIAPGSYLVISHITGDSRPEAATHAASAYAEAGVSPAKLRSREQIAAMFDGFDLVDPGRLVYVPQWHPDAPQDVPDDPSEIWLLAGVGRKP